MSSEIEVGIVTHFFAHINVAGIEIKKGPIKVGDTLHFKGHTTDFEDKVASIQIEHDTVEEAKTGQSIGIKVSQKAREHDKVFKVVP